METLFSNGKHFYLFYRFWVHSTDFDIIKLSFRKNVPYKLSVFTSMEMFWTLKKKHAFQNICTDFKSVLIENWDRGFCSSSWTCFS